MKDLVLVTGISGFIAKHVALSLLREGFAVRGTMRSLKGAEKVRTTLAKAGADIANLTFVEADLTSDDGWKTAAKDCRYVQHIASPFPMQVPRDREALVPAAKAGALRVIDASLASGAERIVMTSSMVAMMYRPGRNGTFSVSEGDWTDTEWDKLTAYMVSKTRAEKAAWQFVEERGARRKLAVVNPGFVLGPALDDDIGTSIAVIELILKRKYPALPPTAFPIVDARDLAAVHFAAMLRPETGGRRLVSSGETMSFIDMSKTLREGMGHAGRRAPTLELPAFAVRLMANFDASLRAILPDLGVRPEANSAYVTELTGVTFRPPKDAVLAAGESLVQLGLVPS